MQYIASSLQVTSRVTSHWLTTCQCVNNKHHRRWQHCDLQSINECKQNYILNNMHVFRLREATPLEELNRSWVQKPGKVDQYFFQSKIDQFKNPDNDEHRVMEHIMSRRQRRKQLQQAKSSS